MSIPRWSVAELEKEVLVKNCKIVKGCEEQNGILYFLSLLFDSKLE